MKTKKIESFNTAIVRAVNYMSTLVTTTLNLWGFTTVEVAPTNDPKQGSQRLSFLIEDLQNGDYIECDFYLETEKIHLFANTDGKVYDSEYEEITPFLEELYTIVSSIG